MVARGQAKREQRAARGKAVRSRPEGVRATEVQHAGQTEQLQKKRRETD